MIVITFINITCTVLSLVLLHSLSRRVTKHVCSPVNDLLPTDPWIIYIVVFTSGLVTSFHVAGVATLATGAHLVHIATVTGLLVLWWCIARWIMGPLHPQTEGRACARALMQARKAVRSLDPLVRWCAIIVGGIFFLFLVEASTRPPEGWDAMVYHLPLAVKWLQQGSLAFNWESWKFQMPSNGELIALFVMYLGDEHVLALAYLPFTLLAILVVYSLAYRLSESYEAAVLVALGFGTMPIVLHNTFDASVDMFAASFFLSSSYLLFRLIQWKSLTPRTRVSFFGLAGLAFGIGLGARYSYAPLLLLMTGLSVLVSIIRSHQVRSNWSGQVTIDTVSFVVGSLLPSLFWYGRNYMATGNPLYPLQFFLDSRGVHASLKGLEERPGLMRSATTYDTSCLTAGDHDVADWLVAPWKDCWYSGGAHFSENWGLGPIFTTFVPTFTCAVVLFMLVRAVRQRQLHPVFFPLLIAGFYLTYWWQYLFTMARWTFPVMGMLFAVVAFGIGTLSRLTRNITFALFLCAMVVNAILVAAIPLQQLGSRLHHHSWSHSRYYEITPVIDELPAGSVILNASYELKNYPLFGRHWQNHVITDRALLEPTLTLEIGEDFIKQWGVQYIYFDSRQKWKVRQSIIRQVMTSQTIGEGDEAYEEVLYKVSWD